MRKPHVTPKPPAQPVDELAAAALAAGQPPHPDYPACGQCGQGWHGLPRKDNGCPGSINAPISLVRHRPRAREKRWVPWGVLPAGERRAS